jgi:DNA-binding CsgD family transcriptional regulator
MTAATIKDPARTRKTLALSGLLVIQAACTAFFVLDIVGDWAEWAVFSDGVIHKVLELVAVAVLATGVALTTVEIRRIRTRQQRVEAQLRVASGAFLDLLEEHFESWGLTPSERDVALLMMKGLPIAEVAALRNTREGTVKAQCNAIYSKAGVSGRQQLLSVFIEELMAERLMPAQSAE